MAGQKHSTLDLCGHGRFALCAGIGGEAWVEVATASSAEPGLQIDTRLIGPRRTFLDHTGDWARARDVSDAGCGLVRPDHHVAWRSEALTDDPAADLRRVLKSIVGR